jgi:hypothetical protein
LGSARWATLRHAYGDACDVPELLRKLDYALDDAIVRKLTEALCHQGNVYSASYAALPHLVDAQMRHKNASWPLICLIAGIEIARLEKLGPEQDADLAGAYFAAIARSSALSADLLRRRPDRLVLRSALALLAASASDAALAKAILYLTDDLVYQIGTGEL